MIQFLTYKTPSKFLIDFEEHVSNLNLRSIKIVSFALLIIGLAIRTSSFLFSNEVRIFKDYPQLSLNNWLLIMGSLTFLIISSHVIRNSSTIYRKKIITLSFVAYLLTVSFNISFIMSMHNTKNTLLIFLVGIVSASLFFTIAYKYMRFVVAYIVGIYLTATFLADIDIQEKIINLIAALLLGVILLGFSRYSYYLKSNYFIQIKELEEKNKEIQQLNDQKSEILSFVAHDLRAPLNNIDAISQLFLAEDVENKEMKMIANAALQAKIIINDLIDAVKTEPNNILKEQVLLRPYLLKIIQKWETNTTRKINFSQPNQDLAISANPSKLERVIDNLISNAFKFSAKNQPVMISVSQSSSSVLLKVSDLGIGIPADLQVHIFERFSKASRKGLLGENSIGLGLHIAHQIIHQHNGVLSVSSEENGGTTFTIQLPA